MIPKNKRYRDKKYLKWVETLPCSFCGSPSDDAHHAIGVGLSGMGLTADDLAAMPVCRMHHTEIHSGLIALDLQWQHIALTLIRAKKEGIL